VKRLQNYKMMLDQKLRLVKLHSYMKRLFCKNGRSFFNTYLL